MSDEKEKQREKTEEKRQTEWTEFCIKRRQRIGYQGKTDQWIHVMQKTTSCTCITHLVRGEEEVNDWYFQFFCEYFRFVYTVVCVSVVTFRRAWKWLTYRNRTNRSERHTFNVMLVMAYLLREGSIKNCMDLGSLAKTHMVAANSTSLSHFS